jgi:hypothetical protein
MLVDDLIATKLSRLNKDITKFYQVCKVTPSEAMWDAVSKLEDKLVARLQQRPTTAFEIDAACGDFNRQFQKLCVRK